MNILKNQWYMWERIDTKKLRAMACFASLRRLEEERKKNILDQPLDIYLPDRYSLVYGDSLRLNRYVEDLYSELKTCGVTEVLCEDVSEENLAKFTNEQDYDSYYTSPTPVAYKRATRISFDVSKLSWQAVYAIGDLFRLSQENPYVPNHYCYIRDKHKELNFYQSLCLSCVLHKEGGPIRGWSHGFIGYSSLSTVKNLSMQKVIDGFEERGWFLQKNSINSFGFKNVDIEISNNEITKALLPDSHKDSMGLYSSEVSIKDLSSSEQLIERYLK